MRSFFALSALRGKADASKCDVSPAGTERLAAIHSTARLVPRLVVLAAIGLLAMAQAAIADDDAARAADTSEKSTAEKPAENVSAFAAALASTLAPKPLVCLDNIPAEPAFFVAIRPLELFAREELRILEDVLSIGGSYQHPVPITQIEQITFVAEQREGTLLDSGSLLIFDLNILRTTVPVDWDEALADADFPYETLDVDGTPIYRMTNATNVCLWLVDEFTYIAGPEDSIRRAIQRHQAGDKQLPVRTAWPGIGDAQMVVAMPASFLNDRIEDLADLGRGGNLTLSLAATALKNIVADADSLVMALRYDAGKSLPMQLRTVVGCPTEELAVSKQRPLRGFETMMKQYALQQKRANESGPRAGARRPMLVDLGEALFEHVEFEPRGTSAVTTFSADAEGGMAVAFLAGLLGDLGGFGGANIFTAPYTEAPVARPSRPTAALPSGVLNSPRLVARRDASAENLRKIAVALERYAAEHGRLPAWASVDASGRPLLSWRVHLLPYLGHDELYQAFRLDEPWDSEHNRALVERMPDEYAGPPRGEGGEGDQRQSHAAVFVIIGQGSSPFSSDGASTSRDAETSAAADSILLIELRRDVPWSCPDDVRLDENGRPPETLTGLHPGGAMVCDTKGRPHFVLEAEIADLLAGRVRLPGPTDGETAEP